MRSLAVSLLLLSTIAGILGRCRYPQPPEFGKMTLQLMEDDVLSVMYSCNEDRRLRGHKVATCNGDDWNHPTPKCVSQNNYRNLRPELYIGDEPAREGRSQESKPQESKLPENEKDSSQSKDESQKKVHKRSTLKKGRRTREHRKNGAKRRKASQEDSLSVTGATRLNETVVSQLDTSCTKKNPKKRSTKAPSIEHAHKPRYARSLQPHNS